MTPKSGLSKANSDVVHEMCDDHFPSVTIARRIGTAVVYVDNEIAAYRSRSHKNYIAYLASIIF